VTKVQVSVIEKVRAVSCPICGRKLVDKTKESLMYLCGGAGLKKRELKSRVCVKCGVAVVLHRWPLPLGPLTRLNRRLADRP
jgi:YgiT-type zinc finger domain-containing protein